MKLPRLTETKSTIGTDLKKRGKARPIRKTDRARRFSFAYKNF